MSFSCSSLCLCTRKNTKPFFDLTMPVAKLEFWWWELMEHVRTWLIPPTTTPIWVTSIGWSYTLRVEFSSNKVRSPGSHRHSRISFPARNLLSISCVVMRVTADPTSHNPPGACLARVLLLCNLFAVAHIRQIAFELSELDSICRCENLFNKFHRWQRCLYNMPEG